jgi:glycosyltransferase involved in cell wall biosynthesis
MKILFLSRWFPYPPINGSKLRIYNLLREIAREHEITLLSLIDDPSVKVHMGALEAIVDEVRIAPLRPFKRTGVRARVGFLSPKPRFVVDTFSPVFANLIRQTIARKPFDLVIASQIDTAIYRKQFRDIPAIFEEVETAILRERFVNADSWRRVRTGLTWLKHRRYLRSLLSSFQACTFASEQERRLVERTVGCPTWSEVVPNAVDVSSYAGFGRHPWRNEWIFAGSLTYSANYEAVAWFIERVLPLILPVLPGFRLTVTGRAADRPLPEHASVSMSGLVNDIAPFMARSWGSVAPILAGGGTRLKILVAMALGVPVVSTSKGAEGIDAVPGRHLLIGDTPRQFAQHITRLSGDLNFYDEISRRGRELVAAKYDAAIAGRKLLDLIDRTAQAENGPEASRLKARVSSI